MARPSLPIPDRLRKYAIYTVASRIKPSYVPEGQNARTLMATSLIPTLRRINASGELLVSAGPDLPGLMYSFKLSDEEFTEAVTLARSWIETGFSASKAAAEGAKIRDEADTFKGGSIHALEGPSEESAKHLVHSLKWNGWLPGEPYEYGDGKTWCVEVADTPAYYNENGWDEVDALNRIANRFGFSWSAHETTLHIPESITKQED